MNSETQNIPMAMDARMLGSAGTGVKTYAEAMHAALNARYDRPLLIGNNGSGRHFAAAGRIEKWFRWCEAWLGVGRSLTRRGDRLVARDVFRLAQVHFDHHGSLLRFRAPGRAGIVHWSYPLPLMIEGWINLYTVHDAIPLLHPELTPIDGGRHRRLLHAIIEQGRIITVSQAARHDIVASLGCSEERITACPTGLAIPSGADLPPELVPGTFFLAIGSIEPRKNLLRLVEAYRASGTARRLIVAGPSGWQSAAIEAVLSATPGILRMHYPSRAVLMALLNHARALLFPTFAEGFGLPIVEAMAIGTPVMTSLGGATEEISGGASLLVDPLSVDGMATAIKALDQDDALVETLAGKGRIRATAFTIEAFGDRLAALHQRLLLDEGWINATAPAKRTS